MDLPFRLCRTFDNAGMTEHHIASDNENVFIPLPDGRLKSVEVSTGTVKWESDLGGQIIQTPYLFGDYLVVISKTIVEELSSGAENNLNVSTGVRLVNKNNGLVKWKVEIAFDPDNPISIYGFNERLIIVGEIGGIAEVNQMDSLSGKIIGKKSLQNKLSAAPFFAADQIVLGTTDRQVLIMSVSTLETAKSISVADVPTFVALSGNNLLWANKRGRLTAIGAKTGSDKQKWVLRIGGEIVGIISFQKNLLITSLDNYIYSVSADKGDILWKRRLSNRPAFVPLLIRNYLVVLAVGDPSALIVNAESGVTVNKIIIGNENFFVGSPGKVFPFIFFPTIKGIFFYTSESETELTCL